MALLGKKVQSVGDRIRYFQDCPWLFTDEVLTGVTATVDSGSAVCDGITISADNHGFYYFVSEGSLDDQFNVIFTQHTSRGEIRNDHVQFNIVTNGGTINNGNMQGLMESILGPTGPTGANGSGDIASIIVDSGPPPSGGIVGQAILVGGGPPS